MQTDKNSKKRWLWQLPFLLLLIVGTVLIVRQQRNMTYQHDSGAIFGTVYHVTYQCQRNLKTEIERELQKVDNALSMFNSQSVISQLNQGGSEVPATEEGKMFLEVYQLAAKISEETAGAFDITVAPLVNAWGFGFKEGIMPTSKQVDSLRQFIGYKKVSLVSEGKQRSIRKTHPGVQLDCSAIAKGFGTDVVARYLSSQGIENFMVEIGGEVVTRGISEKRLPWKIGVTKPVEDSLQTSNELQTVLNVTDQAMATSGNYRNFYYKGGKRYAHTIDPTTGYPVQHNILSATVLAKQCAVADAYATSFMVMGLERAREVLSRHPELMAYLIYSDEQGENAVWASPNLKIEE